MPFPPAPADRVGAIVLVHGAWVGEWSWAPLEPRLRATGRAVHAVTLTGHGTKRHQLTPHITLADHVDDLVMHVDTYDLDEIILVGHSYGGRVITAAYGQLAERIARMVYLDAHAPLGEDAGQSPERLAAAKAAGGMLEIGAEYRVLAEHVGGPDGVTWFMDRIVPQSFATFTVPITGVLPAALPKAYLFCSGYGPSRFEQYAASARAADDWEYYEIATDHWPMYSHPDDVTAIIVGPED